MVRASEPSIQPPDQTPNPPSRLPLPRGDASTDDESFSDFPPRTVPSSPVPQTMYVRVKRARTTMFLHVEPTETVLELKAKIQLATDGDDCPGGFPPRTQKLLVGPGWHSAMEDGMQLQELKVENDMEIALVLLHKVDPPDGSPEGTEPTEEWEEVRIEEPGASEPAA